jgi:hypothetical protein
MSAISTDARQVRRAQRPSALSARSPARYAKKRAETAGFLASHAMLDNHLAATRDDQLMAEQDLHEAAAPMGGLYRTDSTGSPNSPVTTDHRIAIFVPEPVFCCRRHGHGYFTELRNRFARIYPRWSGRRKSRPRLTALSARLPEEGDVVSRWFLGRPERRLQALGLAILRRACSISPGERDVAASALWVDHKSYLTSKFREMAVLV